MLKRVSSVYSALLTSSTLGGTPLFASANVWLLGLSLVTRNACIKFELDRWLICLYAKGIGVLIHTLLIYFEYESA